MVGKNTGGRYRDFALLHNLSKVVKEQLMDDVCTTPINLT